MKPLTKLFQLIKKRPKASFPILVISSLLFIFLMTSSSAQKTSLELTSISPEPPTFESLLSTHQIKLNFSHPLQKETIKYTISPETDTRLIFDPQYPTLISILTLDGLEPDTPYTFTIHKGLTSTENLTLKMNLQFELTRTQPDLENFFPPNQGF